jgi:rhomboid protease GluP
MIDLNPLLLFIAFASPLILLARTRQRSETNRGWRLASLAVLIVTAVSFLLAPRNAGFIGGGAWLVLLFIPAIGLRKGAELATRRKFGAARRLISLLRVIHPAAGLTEESELLRALELAQKGEIEPALAFLAPLTQIDSAIGRQATAQGFAIRGDWNGLLAWHEGTLQRDLVLLPLYLRALGETAAYDDLVLQFAARTRTLLSAPQYRSVFRLSLLTAFTFCGRTAAVIRLLERGLREFPIDVKNFWIGASELAAGEVAAGIARLEKLRHETSDAMIRAAATRRLEHRDSPAVLSPSSELILRRFEHEKLHEPSIFLTEKTRATPVVVTLVILNVAMFALEYALGGTSNPLVLHRLGELEPASVIYFREYWRLVTALFLHFGWMHILFNLYALYVLGPSLERSMGGLRFATCYLISGIGSNASVVILRWLGWIAADELVGASGSIMGIVGAWAGLLLRHRHAPLAGRRLQNILLIVVMQTVFDLITPQVSMAAHLSGLITGLVVGFALAPRVGAAASPKKTVR